MDIIRKEDGTLKIIIVGSFRHEMYASAFSNGFRQLGYDVIDIDYDSYRFCGKSIISSLLNRVQNRYHYGLKMWKYNREIISKVENEHPDFVFLYRCYHIYASTVRTIAGSTKVFSYNNDDPFSGIPSKGYFRHFIADAKYCHINYVYRKKNIHDFDKIGIKNTKVLLPYFRKADNHPLGCEKDIPLAFLGHFENDGRDQYILSLKEAGLPVAVYGDTQWKKSPLYEKIKDVVFPDKRGEDYNLTINKCKICLVFFSKLNHDTYTRRCFEIPATKTVMLSEYTEDMNELFPENECAVYFRDNAELIEKAKWLLVNPSEIDRIANNAYKRLNELGGTEIDRCKQIVNDYHLICKQ